MDELNELKKILESYRHSNPKLKKFPDQFWSRVLHLSNQIPSSRIATFLNIDLPNLNKRIREAKFQAPSPQKMAPQQFLEVPLGAQLGPQSKSTTKQIVLSFPFPFFIISLFPLPSISPFHFFLPPLSIAPLIASI